MATTGTRITTLCDAFAAAAATQRRRARAEERRRSRRVDLARTTPSASATRRPACTGSACAAATPLRCGCPTGPSSTSPIRRRCSSAPLPFSIYSTFTVEQAEHVVADAGCRVLVTEPAYLEQALAVRERGRTALELHRPRRGRRHAAPSTWDELLAAAPAGLRPRRHAAADVSPDDLATLIYTSGTTGAPKGVELTHANVVAQCSALVEALGLEPRQRAISWLPMAHIAERLCTHYIPLHLGWTRDVPRQPARASAVLLTDVRPQFFFSPPRLWEKLRAAAIAKLGERPDGATALAALGLDEVRAALTGAAPCPPEVVEFWQRAAASRCARSTGCRRRPGVATVNAPGAMRIGTVGRPLPGVEVALSDAGEVLMRGPVVMRGYRNRPDATAEALDARRLDALRRRRGLRRRRLPADRRPHQGADHQRRRQEHVAREHRGDDQVGRLGRSAACARSAMRGRTTSRSSRSTRRWPRRSQDPQAEVAAQIERANEQARARRADQALQPSCRDWPPGGDELTPTMKLKRKPIAAKYAAEIDALYA